MQGKDGYFNVTQLGGFEKSIYFLYLALLQDLNRIREQTSCQSKWTVTYSSSRTQIFNKIEVSSMQVYCKETQAQVLPCELCDIFKNLSFTERLHATLSGLNVT